MFSTLRTRFGIPGVISAIALVFALVGGAYAANNSTSGGKATASAKAKKGPRGPKGATGPAGPAGAQGPAGPAGAKGDAGSNGTAGATGATGPTGSQGAKGSIGATGATGPTGATGATGFSGFTETLPSGKTETGLWDAGPISRAYGGTYPNPISFAIPLPAPSLEVKYLNLSETESSVGSGECEYEPSNPAFKPVAPAGTLCVFVTAPEEGEGVFERIGPTPAEEGDSVAGALVWINTPEGEFPGLHGVWAVTAS